jgi:hypothetical protein
MNEERKNQIHSEICQRRPKTESTLRKAAGEVGHTVDHLFIDPLRAWINAGAGIDRAL